MGNIATWAAVFPAALILLFLLYKKIKSDYRKFCIEEDEKEETEKIVSKINALRETVLRSGDDALKANLLAKIDLCGKIIGNRNVSERKRLFGKLLGVLSQSLENLKKTYDVREALSPINLFTRNLVLEHIDYLKKLDSEN